MLNMAPPGQMLTFPVSPTVQVFGVPGVRPPGCVDQHGLDLRHPHPVSLHPPLQHLPGENPLALLRHRPLHPRHVQVRALCVLAGEATGWETAPLFWMKWE